MFRQLELIVYRILHIIENIYRMNYSHKIEELIMLNVNEI